MSGGLGLCCLSVWSVIYSLFLQFKVIVSAFYSYSVSSFSASSSISFFPPIFYLSAYTNASCFSTSALFFFFKLLSCNWILRYIMSSWCLWALRVKMEPRMIVSVVCQEIKENMSVKSATLRKSHQQES